MRGLLLSVVAALALAGCAGTVDGSGPSTSVRVRVTTAPAAATAAPLPTTAGIPVTTAPAATAPTTTAPVAATTTTLAPSPTLLGPAPNLVTLLESPRATRQEPAPVAEQAFGTGVLVEASNPAYDRAFVVSLFAGQSTGIVAAPGWTLRPIGRDPQWTPTALAAAPHTFVGLRWVVYVDAPRTERQQVVAFDAVSGAMTSYLETPLRAHWFAVVDDLDDHTVGLLFDPSPADPSADPAVADIRDRLAVRRLDLRTGRATDTELRLPNGFTYRDAWFDGSGGVVVATTSDEQLRAPAGQPLRAVDPTTPGPEPTVDAVRLDRSGDPAADVPVRDAAGAVLAQVFPWRLQGAPADALGLVGWSAGRGWFVAVRNAPDSGAPPHAGPGVYDVATATWDWVVSEDSPVFVTGLRQLVVGTIARAPS